MTVRIGKIESTDILMFKAALAGVPKKTLTTTQIQEAVCRKYPALDRIAKEAADEVGRKGWLVCTNWTRLSIQMLRLVPCYRIHLRRS